MSLYVKLHFFFFFAVGKHFSVITLNLKHESTWFFIGDEYRIVVFNQLIPLSAESLTTLCLVTICNAL